MCLITNVKIRLDNEEGIIYILATKLKKKWFKEQPVQIDLSSSDSRNSNMYKMINALSALTECPIFN